jgi:hypothetical protein
LRWIVALITAGLVLTVGSLPTEGGNDYPGAGGMGVGGQSGSAPTVCASTGVSGVNCLLTVVANPNGLGSGAAVEYGPGIGNSQVNSALFSTSTLLPVPTRATAIPAQLYYGGLQPPATAGLAGNIGLLVTTTPAGP